ncbi:MAG: hypothetical protein IJ799_06105, partial [Bacteroidales bacterium]|nr:hypothetical protein [Bacteroidales bacterium]
SFNRNKIVKISDEADRKSIVTSLGKPAEEVVYFLGNSLAGSNYCIYPGNIFMEGYPMGLFYGWKVKGIVGVGQTGTPASASGEPVTEGMLDYYDLNGNGYIDDDDRTIIGNPNPAFTFGFGTSITWKRLSLSMDFNGSWGNDIININRAVETDTYSGLRNVLRDAYFKAWMPDNTATKYPGLGMVSTNDTKKVSSFYVEDGSYLRLASLSLSYDVPVKNNNVLKGMTIAGTVNNVFVLTRYEGWDPDVNSFGSNIKKMGCDSGSYPGNRAFSFDVKLTF